jgi:hypothetical protein
LLDGMSRAQLVGLDGLDGAAVDDAVEELRRAQLVSGSAAGYALRGDEVRRALGAEIDAEARARLHDALGELCAAEAQPTLVLAHHGVQGRQPQAALDTLLLECDTVETRTKTVMAAVERVGARVAIETLCLALELEQKLDRGPANLMLLWPMIAGVAAGGQSARYYHAVREPWLERLKQDSGFHDWHQLTDEPDPMTRALKAFGAAHERHEAQPPHERGMAPADAIKEMVSYVVFSIAVAARTHDVGIMLSLPDLLEPFEKLNPLVRAMKLDAEGARESLHGRREQATRMFRDLLVDLDAMEGVELAYVERIQAALWQAVALAETAMGIPSDALQEESWQKDPSQLVGAEYIRKIAALHRGDWEAAENHRRQAELLALETLTGSMFATHLEELEAHALARDLTGTRSVRQRIRELARNEPLWEHAALAADAFYYRICGEHERALEAVHAGRTLARERGVGSRSTLDAAVVEVESLLELGRAQEAFEAGRAALEDCERVGRRHAARTIACGTALAQAAVGDFEGARTRMHRVIEAQRQRGVRGLLLGRSYEHLARIAILEGDAAAFEHAAAITAAEYRVGRGSMLGAPYERLLEAARAAGVVAQQAASEDASGPQRSSTLVSHVITTLLASNGERARARAALSLLCDVAKTDVGHLFLLTEAGLTHAASSSPTSGMAQLQTHARSHLELELDDDQCTVTAELMTGFESQASSQQGGTFVEDGDGVRYRALSLRALHDREPRIVGVVLLGAVSETAFELGAVSVAIARHLLESGDYRPVLAA